MADLNFTIEISKPNFSKKKKKKKNSLTHYTLSNLPEILKK